MNDRYSSMRWWDPDLAEGDVAGAIIPYVQRLEQRQKARHRMDRLYSTLYADMPIRGLGPFAYTQIDEEPESARLNLIKAVVDTWVAAMVKNTPRPSTSTTKGDWTLKRRGEGLNLWLEGTYDDLDIPNFVSPFALRLAAVSGTAFVKVYEDVPGGPSGDHWDEAKVGADVIFQDQITIDEAEAKNPRNLRSIFVREWYDVDVLCEMFPGSKSEIRDAPRGAPIAGEGSYGEADASNIIEVVEGYHLRSSRLAKDGTRAIAIPGKTLARVPYTLDRFPIVPFRRAMAPRGLFGIGIAQELRGSQTTINEIMLAYEEAMIFFARPKWMVPRGSGVERAHLDDRIASVVEFDGPVAPVMYVPNAVMPGDVMQVLQMVWSRGFEQTGTNQILASGQIPQGLKSGEAIERYNDTGAARGVESMKLYEQSHVDLAELLIESGRAIAEKNPKFASVYQGKKQIELVYFNKVDPGRDRFKLKVAPTSALASTPSAKLEQLDMLFQRGLIDKQTYRVLLDWPDLDKDNALANAPYEVVDKILSDIYDADEGKAIEVAMDARNAPDPNWPLDFMRARVQFACAQAFIDGAPQETLDAMNQYGDLLDAALKTKSAGQSQLAGAPMGPMGGPLPLQTPTGAGAAAPPPMMNGAGPMPAAA